MSDGRIVSLAQRIAILILWLSVVACWLPDDSQQSSLSELNGRLSYGGWLGQAKAAEASKADAAGTEQEEDTAELRQALQKIKIKPAGNGHTDWNLDQIESAEVIATGYTAGIESTGKAPGHPGYGITYSGVKVRKDQFSTIAADPMVFPLGTIMYIPGYGFGVVADIGGAIKGNKIDLYYATKEQVYTEWGKRQVRVYIISRGNGKVTEAMMNRLNDDSPDAMPVENQFAIPSIH